MYSTFCQGIQPEVSDTDIYNKLLYRINADPYRLTLGDIISTEGISVSDKTKALDELQRNQEITSRPNYKAARELFDIDLSRNLAKIYPSTRLKRRQSGCGYSIPTSSIRRWNRWMRLRRLRRITGCRKTHPLVHRKRGMVKVLPPPPAHTC
ncbi:MAG: hypothetical protein E3K40_12735 [Candidatus Brocadia sp.]|nr:hypothetical protein [Candidatus Brocadia sp.]MDG6027549.1 hypothetical protein [Candidatus Brocadia sp.]